MHKSVNRCPVLEVHISNIHRREAFRHPSYVSPPASGVIAGFGAQGQVLAPRRLAALLGSRAP
ncbi:MAG: type II 3-dehydroquinate dehydratase [Acetobacteraceae bacterium]|nr:type II 3-dehydroquinate dehydratase [Acetobacteraceae bacterium]MBV9776560.1 type II 3-dehydroquinate dehydratase [Acetobacteraceae bacterium]